MIMVTQSEIESLRCPLRHYYQYIQRLRIDRYIEKNYIPIGLITHEAVEWLYNRVSEGSMLFLDDDVYKEIDKLIESSFDVYLRKATPDVAKQVEEDVEMTKVLVRAYYENIFMNEEFDVVGSETVFRLRIKELSEKYGEDVYFTGKMDGIFRLPGTDIIYLHELKTKSFFGPVAELEARKSVQVNGYSTVLLNYPKIGKLEGILYTVITKPRKLKSESIEEWRDRIDELMQDDKRKWSYIKRIQMPVPGKSYEKQLIGAVEAVIMAGRMKPYMMPHLCNYCDYAPLCEGVEGAIKNYRVASSPHEELDGIDVTIEAEI